MVIRTIGDYVVLQPLTDMGWRIRKCFYLVKHKENPKHKYILSWMQSGTDAYITDKSRPQLNKCIKSIKVRNVQYISM